MAGEISLNAWLEMRGVKSKNTRHSLVHALRTIEGKLASLGMPYQSLDEAWEHDQFETLYKRLDNMQEDLRTGGQDYKNLLPNYNKPWRPLQDFRSMLRRYGRLLKEPPLGGNKIADRIRQYALERYIKPARAEGQTYVKILIRDINIALELGQSWRNTCQALSGRKFQELAQVPPPERIGPEESSATVYQFKIQGLSDSGSRDSIYTTNSETTMDVTPMNLILYGPPGTGKTFTTAAEAVRLCGEPVPKDRAKLMEIYRHLMKEKQIEFVTFHQSMSYEDFVEGRQPVTGVSGGKEVASAGFRLETVPGIFRRITRRAEGNTITVAGRQVFQMSIGKANDKSDAQFFEEAVRAGYALFDCENIDLSDERYEENHEIRREIEESGERSGSIHFKVLHTDYFRNDLRVDDIIIVSRGNELFRAIGIVTGSYEYFPHPEGRFNHRRAVRWLWIESEGVPVGKIFHNSFNRHTIYPLDKERLNIPALEHYMNSGRSNASPASKSFVLIIDEINRANISKVFGELITLLEPDKRLGQPNELKVRLPYSSEKFGVPSNLHIIGTMNTADRSIALLDTALRRRFTFREIMPDPSLLVDVAENCGIDLPRILETINRRIEYLYDREHQIGHAYFLGCTSRRDVDEVMRSRVIPLLAEYFFEDWAKIAAVLGDLEDHDGKISGGFLNRSILDAPPGFEDGDDPRRFRWQVRSETEGFNYDRLVGA